ncbi:BTAD domain-containing putative transcriptional regulator [Glycomyces buryatensis]|uniref:LysM peptidoglycan-binding domain-containing protein n=1 Tax=Glycomyces buryatensis TaxID=2570927 RepID=A0A4S8PVR4_9ACTN|nr:LysM peptidoglycan-binding domain-containing protein [Glycomyces buryatensis]THV35677.1 LysM peptidoglycan-binding domain-containing protein [Glycomyces buryatensis]
MKFFKATAALIAVAAVLAGPPVLLVQIGWPLPDHLPGLDEVWAAATRPVSDRLLLNALAIAGWLLWAALLRAFAFETWAQIHTPAGGTPTAKPTSRGPLRLLAAVLIAAVLAAGPATAAAPTSAAADPASVSAPINPADEQHAEQDTHANVNTDSDQARQQQADTEEVTHVVEGGDTLWDIAADDDYLDDPLRWQEIYEANEGVPQEVGGTLTDEDEIYPGWELTIPVDEAATDEPAEETPNTAEPSEDPSPGPTSEAAPDPTEAPTPEADPPSESPSTASEETSTPGTDDGLIPAPTATAEPTPTENPSSDADRSTSAAAPPTDDNSAIDTAAAPVGLWLTAGTFLAFGAAFSLLVLAKRRRDRTDSDPGTTGETLTGRLADLETLLDGEEQPTTATDTVLPLGTAGPSRTAEASMLDWTGDGLGLTGPGAAGAARATVLTAVSSQVPIVITASVAETIGLDSAEAPASLNIVPDVGAAIEAAEERADDPVYDLNAGRIDLPPLLLLLEPPGDEATHLAEVLKHDLNGALILGPWDGGELTLAADGTVTTTGPEGSGLEEITRCYIADQTTFTELLTATADPEPTPTDPPEPSDPQPSEPAARPEAEAPEPKPAPAPLPEQGDLRLKLLGTPALLWQDRPVQWRRRKSLLLLTTLALDTEGRTLDDLLETVVGDSHVDKARGHLGTITSDARRDVKDATGLDIRVIVHDDQTERYRLHEYVACDLADFEHERHLAAASTTDTERRDHLTRALSHYGGDFAEGFDDDWLSDRRAELRRAAYTTCLHLAAFHNAEDDPAAAIAVLERATAIDRTRPDAWTALTEARTAIGDEVGAQKARRGQRLWATGDHNTAPM